MKELNTVYPINESMGACVIFNMESFNNKQPKRTGTEQDKTLIQNTFRKFGYEVYPVQNPTESEIKKTMNESK